MQTEQRSRAGTRTSMSTSFRFEVSQRQSAISLQHSSTLMITSSKNARSPSNLFVAFTLAISFWERERGKLGERTKGKCGFILFIYLFFWGVWYFIWGRKRLTVDVMSGLRNRILFCFSNYNRNFLLFAILEKGLKHFYFYFFILFYTK